MTLKEIEIKQAELAKTIEEYKAEQTKSEVKTIYNLQNGDAYFILSSEGDVYSSTWGNDSTDKARLAIGNVYLTELDALRAKAKLEVNAAMQKMSDEAGGVDWTDKNAQKYFFFYLHDDKNFNTATSSHNCHGADIFFPTEELTKKAIELYGDKILFAMGIKDEAGKTNE